MTAKYAYYPGCSLHSTGSEYDVSFRAVCEKLNIDIREETFFLFLDKLEDAGIHYDIEQFKRTIH